MADVQDLGSCAARRVGPSPTTRMMRMKYIRTEFQDGGSSERFSELLNFCIKLLIDKITSIRYAHV